MKRFLYTAAFCVFLLIFGAHVLLPSTNAEKNILLNLLDLPAPPPNPSVRRSIRNLPAQFFNKSKPPEDDALVEDLLIYWQHQSDAYRELGYNPKPSEKTLQRIISEIESDPEKLTDFLNILPENSETADFVKKIYDGQMAREDFDEDWGRHVKRWLTYHSRHFSDELFKDAEKVRDADEYVTNQDELLALARVDWEKARPILERLYSDSRQPVSQTLARWAFYRRALDEDSKGDIEKYRDELKAAVENKSASAGMRDLAFDALVKEKEWSGLDDWYLTLLEDETLADLRVNGRSYTGLTTIMFYSPPEKRLERMLQLVKSNNSAVRGAAVRNLALLLDEKNPEVLRALLPWLEDANWAPEFNGERRRLIAALAQVVLPESVPGLIAVLNEKQTQPVKTLSSMTKTMPMANATGNAANMMSVNPKFSVNNNGAGEDYYPLRYEAISALIVQRDARAITPLRAILPQVESWMRGQIVSALLASRGFSIAEQVEALESAARNAPLENEEELTNNTAVITNNSPMPTPPLVRPSATIATMPMRGNSNVAIASRPFNPSDIKPLLAQQLIGQAEPEEELVTALIERISILDAKDSPTAFGLRRIIRNWSGAAINALLLRDVKNNKTDVDSIVKLLSLRKDLREKQWNDVSDIRAGNSFALGLSACLIESSPDYDALLRGENAEAKTAMLACARLIRAALPVETVAKNLNSPNKLLASAAERYLEAEDSPAAQNFVLAANPNKAKILGARTSFQSDATRATSVYLPALFESVNASAPFPGYYFSSEELREAERNLQKEVLETPELLGVYAFDDNFIRIYRDRAVFSWQTDKARFYERALSGEEFEGFKDYLASKRVNELPPFLLGCEENCEEKELLMLGRNGGRRIYLLGGALPEFFAELDKIFGRMREPEAKLRYALEKEIKGLEILLADDNLSAETVWKNGADWRVLLSDAARRKQIDEELENQDEADETREDFDYEKIWKTRRQRREQREFENFAWHNFTGKKLAGFADQPSNVEFIPKFDGAAARASGEQWKARTPTFEVRADADGLYKISGGQTVKIRDGFYNKPVITTNGCWAAATKYDMEAGAKLVRVNLATKKEFLVDAEDYPRFEAVAFLPSVGKVLIFGGGYGDYESETDDVPRQQRRQPGRGEYYLLDAETGAMQKAKGEMLPFAQQTFRPLQTTGAADEFWAAIPDDERNETSVGTYNAKTFAFKPLLKIPQIKFGSMEMWIDGDKIYFVYNGHLLSLPLPRKNTPPPTN